MKFVKIYTMEKQKNYICGYKMKKYPIKLDYTPKSAVWGGNILSNQWNKHGDGDNVAETWELTVREKEMSKITNGEAKNLSLHEYVSACGAACVSPTYALNDRFPLLVKFIDAGDDLSVQVHPNDDYAKAVEGDSGKTEMWYILEASEGAQIIYGLCDGVSAEDFSKAVADGEFSHLMKRVPVKAGECYFIPSGLVHAIGGGVLLAEIQQNSDLTYRVYDYDRVGKDGKKRELHVEKALSVIRSFSDEEIENIRFEKGKEEGLLANSRYFTVNKIEIDGEYTFTVGDSFVSLLCVNGCGEIIYDGESYPVCRGESYFLPADMGRIDVKGNLEIICSRI